MKYAIIELQGKQYRVNPGTTLTVDRMDKAVGDIVNLEKILLLADDADTKIGTPYLTEVSLSAKVLSRSRGEKIRVATYKAKSRYRKVKGHRQELTTLEIFLPEAKTASKTKAAKAA